jgi:hypothetical protein
MKMLLNLLCAFAAFVAQPALAQVVLNTPRQGAPLGFQHITVTTTAQGLTRPPGAVSALIISELDPANAVCFFRVRDDGVAPTATVGMLTESYYLYTFGNIGPGLWSRDLDKWQVILDTSNATCAGDSPNIDVFYYGA